jgi:methylated-DNA-protein-cysteine methyltransferase related protein
VAELAGLPHGARFVGTVLRNLPAESRIPWHRVLNAQGRISLPQDSQGAREQRDRLVDDGIVVESGRVSLADYRWLA